MFEAIFRDIAAFGVRYAPTACIVAAGAVLFMGLVVLCLKRYFVLSRRMEAFVDKMSGASFELFRTFRDTFFVRKQIYENVLMFVPYAVLLYGLAKVFRRWWRMLLIGAGSSLLIEMTQWVTRTGYFEVDDILTNTVGMMIGYVGCWMAEMIFRRLRKTP